MILISIDEDLARILWVGSHEEYALNFQNNKKTIEKWLRSRNEIK
jgi:mRNA interferase HigB